MPHAAKQENGRRQEIENSSDGEVLAAERYAVTETNVTQLSQPGTFSDPLTEVLRSGARALLALALHD